jgi:hypothetical protein
MAHSVSTLSLLRWTLPGCVSRVHQLNCRRLIPPLHPAKEPVADRLAFFASASSCPARRSRSIRAGTTSDDAGWSSKVVAAVPRCYYFSWNQASRGTWDHNPRSFVFKGRCTHAAAEMAVPAPWARGQTTFPTVRVNCAHAALRRRDVAVRHPATGPPIRGRPRKGALRA